MSIRKLALPLLRHDLPPTSLTLSVLCPRVPIVAKSDFSTSAIRCRRTRDNNRNRGVSAIRRTGLKYPVSMSYEPLPQPVLDPERRSKVKVDENHGLYEFFDQDKQPLSKPEDDSKHGLLTQKLHEQELKYLVHRSIMVGRRTAPKVMGRSTCLMVGMREGAQPNSDGEQRKRETEGRPREI